MPRQTPSQTVGPFFGYSLIPQSSGRLGIARDRIAEATAPGEHIVVTGRIFDGAGAPVSDAMLDVWQADAMGRYAHPADGRAADFNGFGRVATDAQGGFRVATVKPGRVVGADARLQAPHLSIVLFARGMQSHVYTRIYFADEAAANAEDAVLCSVEPERRGTLMAAREDTPGGPVYRVDIHLQGAAETVFFDC